MDNNQINLNVGGVIYTTTKSTLTKCQDSMLAAIFGGNMLPSAKDKDGNYFIDRNGQMFAYILDFLRTDELLIPDTFDNMASLTVEAEYYQIKPLINTLRNKATEIPEVPEIIEKYVGIIETERIGCGYKEDPEVTLYVAGKLHLLRRLPVDLVKKALIKEKYGDCRNNTIKEIYVDLEFSYQQSYLTGVEGTVNDDIIYTDDTLPYIEALDKDCPYEVPWFLFEGSEPKETDSVTLKFQHCDAPAALDEYFLNAGWKLVSSHVAESRLLKFWALPEKRWQ